MDKKTLDYATQCATVQAFRIAHIAGRAGDWQDYRQQILLRIIRTLPRFDRKKGNIKTFLNIVAYSECRTILRNLRAGKNRIISDAIRIP